MKSSGYPVCLTTTPISLGWISPPSTTGADAATGSGFGSGTATTSGSGA